MQLYESANEKEETAEVLFVNASVTYSSILIKVFVMMEHSLKIGARWLLKTDDDAYVNVPQTVQVCYCVARQRMHVAVRAARSHAALRLCALCYMHAFSGPRRT
jgi:hypothetical protein